MNRKAQMHLIDAIKVFAALLTDAYGQPEPGQSSQLIINADGESSIIGHNGELICVNCFPPVLVAKLISDQPESHIEPHPSGLSGEHDVVLDAIQKECLGGE